MNELISQLWTPELTAGLVVIIVLLLILYVLSIIWVVRDAYMRGTQWYIWAIVALVPGVGLIAYLLLRPPLLQIDRDEQELEIALKQRELMRYGECATCGYPVEADYVLCPNCLTQLKNLCRTCHKALDPAWEVCPYCATPVMANGHRHASTITRGDGVSEAPVQPIAAAQRSQNANPRSLVGAQSNAQAPVSGDGATSGAASAESGVGTGVDASVASAGKGKLRLKRQSRRGAKGAQNAADGAPAEQPAASAAAESSAPAQKNNPRTAKKNKA